MLIILRINLGETKLKLTLIRIHAIYLVKDIYIVYVLRRLRLRYIVELTERQIPLSTILAKAEPICHANLMSLKRDKHCAV